MTWLIFPFVTSRLFSHYLHSGAGNTADQFHEHIKYSLPVWNNCVKTHSIRHCIYDADMKKALKVTKTFHYDIIYIAIQCTAIK